MFEKTGETALALPIAVLTGASCTWASRRRGRLSAKALPSYRIPLAMPAQVPRPHYLLYTEANAQESGAWRFVVQALDGGDQVEVADVELDLAGDRLDLLTVIRALESLDQPSRVTLVTSSRFIKQGIDQGLPEWREHDWTWERFGERVAVKHHDLWQRLDRALEIHDVQCRRWRLDSAHTRRSAVPRPAMSRSPAARRRRSPVDGQRVEAPAAMQGDLVSARQQKCIEPAQRGTSDAPRQAAAVGGVRRWPEPRRMALRLQRWLSERAQNWRLRAAQFGTALLPAPWLE